MYDKRSFLSGLAMGLCGKGNPTFEGSGKMLYNGVELPKLPEWDKATYPYAVIRLGNLIPAYRNYVQLYVFKEIDFTNGALQYGADSLCTVSADYTAEDFAWGELAQCTASSNVNSSWILWSNTDIYYPDDYEWNGDTTKAGTLFLAATDPVPVEDTFTKGYHAGAALRRKRRLPVAYLYNGVRLPKLPEWDKTAYPYAYIVQATGLGKTSYTLCVCASMIAEHQEGTENWGLFATNVMKTKAIKTDATEWPVLTFYREARFKLCNYPSDYVFWCNHSFDGPNGEEWITASDPVPVYE